MCWIVAFALSVVLLHENFAAIKNQITHINLGLKTKQLIMFLTSKLAIIIFDLSGLFLYVLLFLHSICLKCLISNKH